MTEDSRVHLPVVIPVVCRKLRTKTAFGALEGLARDWREGTSSTAVFGACAPWNRGDWTNALRTRATAAEGASATSRPTAKTPPDDGKSRALIGTRRGQPYKTRCGAIARARMGRLAAMRTRHR